MSERVFTTPKMQRVLCRAVTVEEFKVGDFYTVKDRYPFKVTAIDARILGERTFTVRSVIDGAISKFRYDKDMRLDYVVSVDGRDPRMPRLDP